MFACAHAKTVPKPSLEGLITHVAYIVYVAHACAVVCMLYEYGK